MICFPNAKINLGLNIINKRSDGYHNIETIFCPIELSDVLEIVELNKDHTQFTLSGIPVDCPSEKNLCIKAYDILKKDFKLPEISIHLHKIIPLGAGLGGGSSDAAFMLRLLNNKFELKLNDAKLIEYASLIGSDCAFFIKNAPMFGYEKGNRLNKITWQYTNLKVVVIHPGIHVSTTAAYSGITPAKPAESLENLIKLPMEEWKDNIFNDFERNIIKNHPVIGNIKTQLYEMGAVYASMSGSGSSVYGLFKGNISIEKNAFPGFYKWIGSVMPN